MQIQNFTTVYFILTLGPHLQISKFADQDYTDTTQIFLETWRIWGQNVGGKNSQTLKARKPARKFYAHIVNSKLLADYLCNNLP